jgi:hypothetical protein
VCSISVKDEKVKRYFRRFWKLKKKRNSLPCDSLYKTDRSVWASAASVCRKYGVLGLKMTDEGSSAGHESPLNRGSLDAVRSASTIKYGLSYKSAKRRTCSCSRQRLDPLVNSEWNIK